MVAQAGVESLQTSQISIPDQREPKTEEFLKIPRLRAGSRAEFIWIGTEIVRSDVEVMAIDSEGVEFSFTRTVFEAEDILKSAVGTITKALPTARQRKYRKENPDTLHFTPDKVEHTAEDGSITSWQPPTMVIPRAMLDDFIITRHQKQGTLSHPALPLLETPTQ